MSHQYVETSPRERPFQGLQGGNKQDNVSKPGEPNNQDFRRTQFPKFQSGNQEELLETKQAKGNQPAAQQIAAPLSTNDRFSSPSPCLDTLEIRPA
jgi:hypothetical protein